MNPYTHYLHIERLRRKLEAAAEQYGRTHHVTLAYSRALDRLIQPIQEKLYKEAVNQ
jgi:16S rRNA U1498 N3-methylase RsmE